MKIQFFKYLVFDYLRSGCEIRINLKKLLLTSGLIGIIFCDNFFKMCPDTNYAMFLRYV